MALLITAAAKRRHVWAGQVFEEIGVRDSIPTFDANDDLSQSSVLFRCLANLSQGANSVGWNLGAGDNAPLLLEFMRGSDAETIRTIFGNGRSGRGG